MVDLQTAPAIKDISAELPFLREPFGVKVSVIIPTLNEAENLRYVLPLIPDVHEVIIVDGLSADGTVDVAKLLLPKVRIVEEMKRGKGAALKKGFVEATGDIIVFLDGDGSMDPAEIPAYVGLLLAGADYAKGSRFLQGGGTADMTMFRYLGNWLFRVCVRLLYGGRFSDLCYGYNAFWKAVLPGLDLSADGFEIETLMNVNALTAGLKVVEVPSFEKRRVHGKSNLRAFPDGWRMLKTIFRLRLKQGIRRRNGLPSTDYQGYAGGTYARRNGVTERQEQYGTEGGNGQRANKPAA